MSLLFSAIVSEYDLRRINLEPSRGRCSFCPLDLAPRTATSNFAIACIYPFEDQRKFRKFFLLAILIGTH
jgi:hypothetical protein